LGRTSTTVRSATLKSLAFFILPASAFLLVASRFWPMTIDDAYISARYAWNAAHGTGLVFNPGERVMGYTNLLLVLLETAVYAVGRDGILAAKVTGIVAAISLLAIIYGLARELDPLRWRQVGTIAIIPLILFPDLAIGAV